MFSFAKSVLYSPQQQEIAMIYGFEKTTSCGSHVHDIKKFRGYKQALSWMFALKPFKGIGHRTIRYVYETPYAVRRSSASKECDRRSRASNHYGGKYGLDTVADIMAEDIHRIGVPLDSNHPDERCSKLYVHLARLAELEERLEDL